jgi:cytochrome c-type biogenesis protein CcmE
MGASVMGIARAKFVIAGTLLIGAASYLAFASMRSDLVYFVDVDGFVQSHPSAGRHARVHGVVSETGADIRRAEMTARFNLDGQAEHLTVMFRGPLPELFQTGRQVVVEGSLDQQGVFQARTLMTKCASKYEECDQPRDARLEAKP